MHNSPSGPGTSQGFLLPQDEADYLCLFKWSAKEEEDAAKAPRYLLKLNKEIPEEPINLAEIDVSSVMPKVDPHE